MKKIICLLLVCATTAVCFCFTGCEQQQPIRIHIRAHSNAAADQAVKLLVRDETVEYLTEKLKNAASRSDAYNIISKNLGAVQRRSDKLLERGGYNYGTDAELVNEYFPARTYDGKVFDSGNYDALIINLGDGAGDNWWCVAYPPLCFYGNETVEYSSLIAEWFF